MKQSQINYTAKDSIINYVVNDKLINFANKSLKNQNPRMPFNTLPQNDSYDQIDIQVNIKNQEESLKKIFTKEDSFEEDFEEEDLVLKNFKKYACSTIDLILSGD